jgi:hypothetical protein
MMRTFTTKVKTKDGTVYDLGKLEYPPQHNHKGGLCPICEVVNAWTCEAQEEILDGF